MDGIIKFTKLSTAQRFIDICYSVINVIHNCIVNDIVMISISFSYVSDCRMSRNESEMFMKKRL